MRTKTLLITAALMAAGIASSQAQAVYSANMVGYINKPLSGGLNLICNQLRASPDNTVQTLFGNPTFTLIITKFRPATQDYQTVNYGPEDGYAGDLPMSLDPGQGAFVDVGIAAAATTTLTLVGEVPLVSSVPINTGLGLYGYAVPQSLPIDTPSLGFNGAGGVVPPGAGSLILLIYNKAANNYDTYNFSNEDGWSPSAPAPGIAEGFWLDWGFPSAATWNRTFPVGP